MSKKLPTQQELEALDASLLQKLAQADTPLSESTLLGTKNKVARQDSLIRLRASNQIVAIGAGRNLKLALATDLATRFEPVALAKAAVLAYLGSSLTPLTLKKTNIAAIKIPAHALHARDSIMEAIHQLKMERLLVPIEYQKNKELYVSAAGLKQYLNINEPQATVVQTAALEAPEDTAAPQKQSVTEDMVREAYAAIRQPGFFLVKIGAIQRHLNCNLIQLHTELLQMLSLEKIYLEVGEPTLLEEQDLAAGITYKNKTYYFIEVR
jgi:hypothetical protein